MFPPISYSSVLVGLSRHLQQAAQQQQIGGGSGGSAFPFPDDGMQQQQIEQQTLDTMTGEAGREMKGSVGAAFGLAFGAGAFSLVGASIIFCTKHLQAKTAGSDLFVAGALSLAGGVMLYVSLVDILTHSVEHFETYGYSLGKATLCSTIAYFVGMALISLLDLLIHKFIHDDGEHAHAPRLSMLLSPPADDSSLPHQGYAASPMTSYQQQEEGRMSRRESGYNPRSMKKDDPAAAAGGDGVGAGEKRERQFADLKKVGIMAAIAIGLHNVPEGFATYVGAIDNFQIGAAIALAIAIHNVPEGFAIAVPVYCSTGSKTKACLWSLVATFAEPFGAFLAWIFLSASGGDNTISGATFGWLFGVVGGMMTMVVVQELLPSAFSLDPKNKICTKGIVLGMLIMASSLVMFAYSE